MRLLICETSRASTLTNSKGQTPLLNAIEAGSTSTATLLMEADPRSIIVKDNYGSSVFHYACEYSNDVVLSRAIALLKRLNSSSDRITALQYLVERNRNGKTAFDLAIQKGNLKCVKHFLTSSWLESNIDIHELMNPETLRKAVETDQLDILTFFVSNTKRFSYIINLLIDSHGHFYNLLEYSILLKKIDFVRMFISVRIPQEDKQFRHQYKKFLCHYNEPYQNATNGYPFYETPIQRMLTTHELIPLVPLMLEQFVSDRGIDLSIVDDCLFARPNKLRCIFGRTKHFSSDDWLEQHPLRLIAKADCKDVYDHRIVRMCVDLKFNLFGNFLYFIILCSQLLYVTLYTGITLGSPTPAQQGTSYYKLVNYTCSQMCYMLANDVQSPLKSNDYLRALRFTLLLFSCLALLKEFFQIFTQREKYFGRFFINLIELHISRSCY
ncbi:unnamed protein product [Didymodactylos carnosus]|uniref:ANK_REP_REGION domain-containing protein n=1 Tax=Didymodactylos carnosus TaxID=1234261 RepID=A0A816AJ60_9BILA|nr:unnamed protein product [Didymodactylos carnosus]CAF1598207.1 unnamed protein product [Didymodactylos carnosus]CAF4315032.1 unnamed protein product [Didymodactylos carnosus]CAF4474080.1 unnamed protein product [Didymodactylos carnosus]